MEVEDDCTVVTLSRKTKTKRKRKRSMEGEINPAPMVQKRSADTKKSRREAGDHPATGSVPLHNSKSTVLSKDRNKNNKRRSTEEQESASYTKYGSESHAARSSALVKSIAKSLKNGGAANIPVPTASSVTSVPDETQKDGNPNAVSEVDRKLFQHLGVCPELCNACAKLGWTAATPIQTEAIPYAINGRDLIGLAETGSGKTAAFGLPILQRLMEAPQGLYALILAPTRELAFQIGEQLEALGADIGLSVAVVVGGIDMLQQQIALARKPHVVVSTPGRIVDHLQNTKGFSLRYLKALVMDEADKLLNMDFEKEINLILSAIPKERTTYLFSATMTSKVAKLQRASLTNPVKLEVSNKYGTVKTLLQHYLFIPAKYKDCYLAYLLNEYNGNSMIVFAATCHTCTRLSIVLRALGFRAVPLHGQLSQQKRLGALNRFKSNSASILIATDVASRGLDIPSVDVVVNYDLPVSSKDYVHRVGRTARAGRSGRTIAVVTQYDVEVFQRIEKSLGGMRMDQYPADEPEVLLLLERVSEAQRQAQMELREISEKKGTKRGKRGQEENDDEVGGWGRGGQRQYKGGHSVGTGKQKVRGGRR